MSSNSLTPRAPLEMGTLSDPAELGRMLAASGYFSDVRDAAQAVVKVLAGQELGFGPIASMTGVYIVKGRVTLSANLMAAAIKRHPRYDYRVVEHSDTAAVIRFLEHDKDLGTSEFTLKDAERAQLLGGENWKKYPRNMLFWRALSNGAKFYCPDAFAGAPVYTPDELGADTDPATGEIIDMPPMAAPAVTEPPVQSPQEEEQRPAPATPAPDDPASAASLEQLFAKYNVLAATRRMALLGFGKQDVSDLTPEETEAIVEHLNARYKK
jgi:hypothetical protein